MIKLKDIFSSLAALPRQKAETVEIIEAMIRGAETERDAAMRGLAVIAEDRLGLLKADDDAALDRNDQQETLHHRTIEKADLALEEMRPRLAEARATRRREKWNDLLRRYKAKAEVFLQEYSQAYSSYLALIEIMGEAQANGFAGEAHFAFLGQGDLPLMFDEQVQERIRCTLRERCISRLPVSGSSVQSAQPNFTAPKTTSKPPNASASKPVIAAPEKPKPRPLKCEKAGEGEVLVSVVRHGYESPTSGPCRYGDVIALSELLAKRAAENGACIFCDTPAVPPSASRDDSSTRMSGGAT